MTLGKAMYTMSTLAKDMGDNWSDYIESLSNDVGLDWEVVGEAIGEEKLFELAFNHYVANNHLGTICSNIDYFEENFEVILNSAIVCGETTELIDAMRTIRAICNMKLSMTYALEVNEWFTAYLPNDMNEVITISKITHTYWKYLNEHPVSNCYGNTGLYDIDKQKYVCHPMGCDVEIDGLIATITKGNNSKVVQLTTDIMESAKKLAEAVNTIDNVTEIVLKYKTERSANYVHRAIHCGLKDQDDYINSNIVLIDPEFVNEEWIVRLYINDRKEAIKYVYGSM